MGESSDVHPIYIRNPRSSSQGQNAICETTAFPYEGYTVVNTIVDFDDFQQTIERSSDIPSETVILYREAGTLRIQVKGGRECVVYIRNETLSDPTNPPTELNIWGLMAITDIGADPVTTQPCAPPPAHPPSAPPPPAVAISIHTMTIDCGATVLRVDNAFLRNKPHVLFARGSPTCDVDNLDVGATLFFEPVYAAPNSPPIIVGNDVPAGLTFSKGADNQLLINDGTHDCTGHLYKWLYEDTPTVVTLTNPGFISAGYPIYEVVGGVDARRTIRKDFLACNSPPPAPPGCGGGNDTCALFVEDVGDHGYAYGETFDGENWTKVSEGIREPLGRNGYCEENVTHNTRSWTIIVDIQMQCNLHPQGCGTHVVPFFCPENTDETDCCLAEQSATTNGRRLYESNAGGVLIGGSTYTNGIRFPLTIAQVHSFFRDSAVVSINVPENIANIFASIALLRNVSEPADPFAVAQSCVPTASLRLLTSCSLVTAEHACSTYFVKILGRVSAMCAWTDGVCVRSSSFFEACP